MGLAPVVDISIARRRRDFIRGCRAEIGRWARNQGVSVDHVVLVYCRTNRIDHVPLGRLTDAHTVRLLADLQDRGRREIESLMQPEYGHRSPPVSHDPLRPRNGRVLPAEVA